MRRKIRTSIATFLLTAVLFLSACTGADTAPTSSTAPATTPSAPSSSTTGAVKTEPATEASEPITITLWSKFGQGTNGDATQYLVDKFNAENGKGITVKCEFIGTTGDIMAQVMTGVVAGTAPELIMMDNSTVPTLAENGVLADVSQYVTRDNFDMSNIITNMDLYSYYGDQIISIPFARSNLVYVYNPDIFAECGVEPPETIADLEAISKTIYQKKNIPAFGLLFDASFYQEALLVGLGSEGNISKDGKRPAALEDGSMKQLLTDWQGWIKEGWCVPPDVTSAETVMREDFYQGKLAALILSTGAVQGTYKSAAELGTNVAVSYMPGYNGYQSGSGGSQIAAVATGKSDAQIAAAWEFMKFMMDDFSVSYFSTQSGYLPTTKSSLNMQELKDYWEKYPGLKVAVDQMEYASEPYWSIYRSDWNAEVKIAMSAVIQDNANVNEQIAYLEGQVSKIFGS
jgi:sn-glycerol 3-phosphate transport system substrate-binding protein